jgi:hypothetical protein
MGLVLSVVIAVPAFIAFFFVTKHRLGQAYQRAIGLRIKSKWTLAARSQVKSGALSSYLAQSQFQV